MPYCTCAKVGYSSCQCNLVDFIIEVTLISIDYIQRYLCVGARPISDHSSLLVKTICRHRFSTQLMELKWIILIETFSSVCYTLTWKALAQGCSTFSWWGPTWKMAYRLGPRVYLLKKFGQSGCTPCSHTKDLRADSDSTHFNFIYISKINSN